MGPRGGGGGGEGVGADAIFTLLSTAFLGNFFLFPANIFQNLNLFFALSV